MPLWARFLTYCEGHPTLARVVRSPLRQHYRERDLASDLAIYSDLASKNFRPHAVLVQISRRCNLRCSMCGWAVWQRNKGFMSLDLYRRVLREMRANGIDNLNLTNPQGEPLLSPHAAECIRLGIEGGFNVNLNTNCTTLGERNIGVICEASKSGSLHTQASFSGFDKETHEAVYQGSRFEDSARKLEALNTRLTALGLERHLTVNGIIMDETTKERHVAFLESLGIDRRRVTLGLPDNFAGIVEVGSRSRRNGFYSFKKDLPHRSLRLCELLAHYILIYDDGKASACSCRDSEGIMEIGDITRESLAEIRNGPRFKAMLAAFMRRDLADLPLCQKCDIPYGDHHNEIVYSSSS